MRAALSIFALLALLAAPAWCNDEPEQLQVQEHRPTLTAAAWCAVRSTRLSGAELDHQEQDEPGCDVGVGVDVLRRGRLAGVAAVGTHTLGVGAAWIASEGAPGRPTVAVSLGVVASYDFETGVDLDRSYLAVGATFGIGRR